MASSNPKPPKTLSPDAAAEWRQLVKDLKLAGRLHEADRGELILLCETIVMRKAAMAVVAREGFVKEFSNGNVGVHPAQKVVQHCDGLMRRLYNDFHLTPASRGAGSASDEDLGDLEI